MIENNTIVIDRYSIGIRLTKLGGIIRSIGVNRGGDIIKAFNLTVRGGKVDGSKLTQNLPGSYPILIGTAE